MKFSALGVAAALGLVMALPSTEARAQIWIGQVVGDTIARQQAAAAEAACRAGAPAPFDVTENARARAAQLLDGYFALTSRSGARDIQKVFARRDDVSWANIDGSVPVLQLGERLDTPMTPLTPMSFVVAGDEMSARGIWGAMSEQGYVDGWYAVDFIATPGFFTGTTWRVWKMTIFPRDQRPEAPGVYCHYDPDQAWVIG